MKKIFKVPALELKVRIYYDPSYSERFPWVLEARGEIQNSFSTLESAKDYSFELALADFTYDVRKAVYSEH